MDLRKDVTQPAFVIGSGRSGTRAMYKALLGLHGVEVHHEFACLEVQRLAAERYMGTTNDTAVQEGIQDLYGSAVFWSPADTWIDCSNKATWLVRELQERFPNARFLNLIRDGRKVSLSYFKKLNDEMYDDYSVNVMNAWLGDQSLPKPPLEKRFWWNIPQPGQPFHDEFSTFSHFERAVYHWVNSNQFARESLETLDPDSSMTVKLEELVTSIELQEQVCEFLRVPYSKSLSDSLSSPKNVIVPIDFVLTSDQRSQFEAIASEEMRNLGYDLTAREDRVVY